MENDEKLILEQADREAVKEPRLASLLKFARYMAVSEVTPQEIYTASEGRLTLQFCEILAKEHKYSGKPKADKLQIDEPTIKA